MYYANGSFSGKAPEPTCIFCSGVICSDFYERAGSVYQVTHKPCQKCGWNPEVKERRVAAFYKPVDDVSPEEAKRQNKALRTSVENLSTALENQIRINHMLNDQIDVKNKEIIELRIELGKEKKKSE